MDHILIPTIFHMTIQPMTRHLGFWTKCTGGIVIVGDSPSMYKQYASRSSGGGLTFTANC